MRISGIAKKLISWIACAAILMGSVVPALAHALQRAPTGDWQEVCTALGSQWVEVDAASPAGSRPQAPLAHGGKHCPLCSSHLATLGMPPAPLAAAWGAAPSPNVVPQAFIDPARAGFEWAPDQPRGPPQSS